jgi:hypothetical protein
MGQQYCGECDCPMSGGNGECGGCQRIGCPAEGETHCLRCADESRPSCQHCDDGCSKCLLIDKYMYKQSFDNYDPYLV